MRIQGEMSTTPAFLYKFSKVICAYIHLLNSKGELSDFCGHKRLNFHLNYIWRFLLQLRLSFSLIESAGKTFETARFPQFCGDERYSKKRGRTMNLLIGIDDTDNLQSRGTGHRVRQLANWLAENELAVPLGITRHQLLVDPRIPYTSHNSSACLSVETEHVDDVWEACREYLLRESAAGSDVGLCLAPVERTDESIMKFARRAKLEVLTMHEAKQTASSAGFQLEGLTGTGGGIIGALAGVGLRGGGDDGRFLWLPGLRELKGVYPVSQICSDGHIDRLCTLDGVELGPNTLVDVGEWVRPVLRGGQSTLFVEEHNHKWYSLPKDRIKVLSN